MTADRTEWRCPDTGRTCTAEDCGKECFQGAAEGDDMLEPLIYAAIMHNGKPKTIGDFVKAAANVVDMLKRREASQTQPKWMWTDGQIEAVRPGPCEPAAFAAGFRYGYSAVASAAAPAHANGLWTVISPGGKVFIGESAHRAANEANKHLRATDPAEVKRWADMLDRLRAENELENERLLAEHGTLNCPACGGSGHIGDVSEPPGAGPEVPAGMALVPIEPTPEMLDAYVQSGNGKTLTGCELDAVRASGRDDWAAMLAATPTVQAPAPAPEPLTWLKFRAVQRIIGAQGGDIDCNEWLEECQPGEIGDDGKPAFPVYSQAPAVAHGNKPVASIYVGRNGEREFDDWKCPLPAGRNELYPGPQDHTDAMRLALASLETCTGVPHWPLLRPTIDALRAALGDAHPPVQKTQSHREWLEEKYADNPDGSWGGHP